ncbi:hypothetical protein GCM10010193_57640 [Kitasatospora atroaurantiaca]|uniref:HTH cro/C1-type domain-containing protein n=1 Tax=Kitasatospora atroaurantiaca TaxID=285545 RepID=A0A561EN60_9ACTN|nr:hypothetical protein [Kitasatospora atroaurantiaca]TWE17009.1 hypothetical protein FB465_2006 [Kitasatospora atroaurantiaca]
MTGAQTPEGDGPTLAGKLQLLLRLRREPDGHIPSARDISNRSTAPGYLRPAISHTQVNDLINGKNTNPTSATLTALARAFEAPAAYLLPGCKDLPALEVFESQPLARTAVRLMQDLEVEDITEVIETVKAIRRRRGLADSVAEIPVPPAGVDQPRQGRPRRRLSFAEAAQRAAEDLEGL